MATASHHHHFTTRCSLGFSNGGEVPTVRIMAGSVTSSSKFYASHKVLGIKFIYKGGVDLNHQRHYPRTSQRRCSLRDALSGYDEGTLRYRWLEYKRHSLPNRRDRRTKRSTLLTSPDDGVIVNGNSHASSNSDVEQMRVKLDQSLQSEDLSTVLIQSIHNAARTVELGLLEHSSSSKSSWFSKAWLGVDENAWIRTLSYQAAVNSLLQAAIEISSQGDGNDRDINASIERSLLRLRCPLESTIREELSRKQPAASEWFWSHQQPIIVTTFVNLFDKDLHFTAATAICCKGEPTSSDIASDVSLLMLALSCIAAITKLGPAKVSCQQFFSMVPDITGRLMDMLLDFVPIRSMYRSMKAISLCREFLFHFGPRAAIGNLHRDHGAEEISFWIDLVQKQLLQAIRRERIWSRLTTCESIEVLEKDLAIFGFFISLGRSTQSFLSSNGFTSIGDPIEGIIRYLIGGSVLSYPKLSSISSYQLYVEVVCEELEWLPFYQSTTSNGLPDTKIKQQQVTKEEIISRALNVCYYWMTSFIKYSPWVENPANIKTTRFLSRGHEMLNESIREYGISIAKDNFVAHQEQLERGRKLLLERDLGSFDKALESVEEALVRLENLLQELHLSSSNSGKEQLKAACSDLERIRMLKKEAEFLEASFRAKAASLEQVDADDNLLSSSDKDRNKKGRRTSDRSGTVPKPAERLEDKPHGLWSSLIQKSTRKLDTGVEIVDQNVSIASTSNQVSESNDILRFELLRDELLQLEKRVQKSTDDAPDEEESVPVDGKDNHASTMLMVAPKKDNFIAKSVKKIKETTTDVWQGTQLLAVDTAAAMVLLKRSLSGDELTEKEKKALQRTLTDLASVVPIGILMLLPVTAVGHAAILAFIQRYVPALIPSTYSQERLDLLRQLEKMKEMEIIDTNAEVAEVVSLGCSNSE
ncbi:uncharacterized protein [Typha angustifolia]|uniref:uncharacterized protein n=1 Tax=Typha angustifolia TaxID=59011 RepID=UPI003C2BC7A0